MANGQMLRFQTFLCYKVNESKMWERVAAAKGCVFRHRVYLSNHRLSFWNHRLVIREWKGRKCQQMVTNRSAMQESLYFVFAKYLYCVTTCNNTSTDLHLSSYESQDTMWQKPYCSQLILPSSSEWFCFTCLHHLASVFWDKWLSF